MEKRKNEKRKMELGVFNALFLSPFIPNYVASFSGFSFLHPSIHSSISSLLNRIDLTLPSPAPPQFSIFHLIQIYTPSFSFSFYSLIHSPFLSSFLYLYLFHPFKALPLSPRDKFKGHIQYRFTYLFVYPPRSI